MRINKQMLRMIYIDKYIDTNQYIVYLLKVYRYFQYIDILFPSLDADRSVDQLSVLKFVRFLEDQ